MVLQVVIVDDDIDNLDILKSSLATDDFEVHAFTQPNKCLDTIPSIDSRPDIFVLDVNMPMMTGFDLCEALQKNKKWRDVPVVFLSAMDSLSDIESGYSAGGSDYVTKPYRPAELRLKLQQIVQASKSSEKLRLKATKAKSVAIDAMSETERLGRAMAFMEAAIPIIDAEGLGSLVIDSFLDLGLQSSLYIEIDHVGHALSSAGQVSSMEEKFLKAAYTQEKKSAIKTTRFNFFEGRLLIAYDHFLLMIKNYAEEEHQQFLDYFGILGNSVNAQLDNIAKIDAQARLMREEANDVVSNANTRILGLSSAFKMYESTLLEVMDHLISEVRIASTCIDITEQQEIMLTNLVEKAMQDLLAMYTKGAEVEEELKEIVTDLEFFIAMSFEEKNNQ